MKPTLTYDYRSFQLCFKEQCMRYEHVIFPWQCAGGVHGYCNCSITVCGMMKTGESSYCKAEPIKYVIKKTVYNKMSAICNSHLQQISVSMA